LTGNYVTNLQLNLDALAKGDNGWAPFREGVEIYRLQGTESGGASSALLRYAPGASVPRHEHTGIEHVLVLSGSQRDERGHYPAGTLVINEPGSSHSVNSDEGCVVLVIWQAPVKFVTDEIHDS
jgi:anti-sigma factor ChrR (cupin superfamily)